MLSRFLPLLLAVNVYAADPVLLDSDELSFSWREISSTSKQVQTVLIEARVCVWDEGEKEARCRSLGKFKPFEVPADGADHEIRKNSDVFSGKMVNEVVAELMKDKMKDPQVRIQLILHAVEKAKDVEEEKRVSAEYFKLPALDKKPEEGKSRIQEKVILRGSGFRTRVLAEIKRSAEKK